MNNTESECTYSMVPHYNVEETNEAMKLPMPTELFEKDGNRKFMIQEWSPTVSCDQGLMVTIKALIFTRKEKTDAES